MFWGSTLSESIGVMTFNYNPHTLTMSEFSRMSRLITQGRRKNKDFCLAPSIFGLHWDNLFKRPEYLFMDKNILTDVSPSWVDESKLKTLFKLQKIFSLEFRENVRISCGVGSGWDQAEFTPNWKWLEDQCPTTDSDSDSESEAHGNERQIHLEEVSDIKQAAFSFVEINNNDCDNRRKFDFCGLINKNNEAHGGGKLTIISNEHVNGVYGVDNVYIEIIGIFCNGRIEWVKSVTAWYDRFGTCPDIKNRLTKEDPAFLQMVKPLGYEALATGNPIDVYISCLKCTLQYCYCIDFDTISNNGLEHSPKSAPVLLHSGIDIINAIQFSIGGWSPPFRAAVKNITDLFSNGTKYQIEISSD